MTSIVFYLMGAALLQLLMGFSDAGQEPNPVGEKHGPFHFRSYNFPVYVMGVKDNAKAYIVEAPTLSEFYLVSPGIKGVQGTVSFESKTKPGYFLRHSGYVLWLHEYSSENLFLEDATFYPRENLFFNGYTAYESYNFPKHYIRHSGYRLRISLEDNTDLLHQDASFKHAEIVSLSPRNGPFMFHSYNFPTYVAGIKNGNEAYITEAPSLSQFILVSPGLKGIEGTVSFESRSQPGHYLRHADYVLWLHKYDSANLYLEDATFYPRKDLFYDGYTVYQSYNFPSYYIRHSGYRLRISQEDNTALLHKDASFKHTAVAPVVPRDGPYTFQSYNFPNYKIGVNNNFEAYIMATPTLSEFILVSPGLKGVEGTVSFESKTKPGYYLRHANYVLWLHKYDSANLYLEDATFYPRKDLFFNGYTVYQSYNFPNHYIRHSNYRLRISPEDNTELLHKDASFKTIDD